MNRRRSKSRTPAASRKPDRPADAWWIWKEPGKAPVIDNSPISDEEFYSAIANLRRQVNEVSVCKR